MKTTPGLIYTRLIFTVILLMPKISAKLQWGQLQRGRQIDVRWVILDDFLPISLYIAETVQDRA